MQIGILQSFLSERLLIHWFEPTRHISNRPVQKLLLLPLKVPEVLLGLQVELFAARFRVALVPQPSEPCL